MFQSLAMQIRFQLIYGEFLDQWQYVACPEGKDKSRVGRWEIFYAYCGNTASTLILYL
jgi:hypothetical protein